MERDGSAESDPIGPGPSGTVDAAQGEFEAKLAAARTRRSDALARKGVAPARADEAASVRVPRGFEKQMAEARARRSEAFAGGGEATVIPFPRTDRHPVVLGLRGAVPIPPADLDLPASRAPMPPPSSIPVEAPTPGAAPLARRAGWAIAAVMLLAVGVTGAMVWPGGGGGTVVVTRGATGVSDLAGPPVRGTGRLAGAGVTPAVVARAPALVALDPDAAAAMASAPGASPDPAVRAAVPQRPEAAVPGPGPALPVPIRPPVVAGSARALPVPDHDPIAGPTSGPVERDPPRPATAAPVPAARRGPDPAPAIAPPPPAPIVALARNAPRDSGSGAADPGPEPAVDRDPVGRAAAATVPPPPATERPATAGTASPGAPSFPRLIRPAFVVASSGPALAGATLPDVVARPPMLPVLVPPPPPSPDARPPAARLPALVPIMPLPGPMAGLPPSDPDVSVSASADPVPSVSTVPVAPVRLARPTVPVTRPCPLGFCGSGRAAPAVTVRGPVGADGPDPMAATLARLGFDRVDRDAAAPPVRRGQVRYFRTADAEIAAALARETGYALLDLTWYRPQPALPTIELRLPRAAAGEGDR